MAFPKTVIATSNQPGAELDICHGRFYFGDNQRGLHLGGGRTVRLFEDGPRSYAIFKLKAKAETGYYMGFCGLNYATHFYVEGKDEGGGLKLDYSGPTNSEFGGDDGHAAGFFLGAAVFTGLELEFQSRTVTWKRGKWGVPYPSLSWRNDGKYKLEYKLDFINLLYEVAMAGQKSKKESDPGTKAKKNNKKISVGAGGYRESISLYDSEYGELKKANKLTLKPSYDIKINVVPYIPGIGKLVDRVNSLPGSSLGIGALVRIFFPIDLEVTRLWVAGAWYGVTSAGTDNSARATYQAANSNYPSNEVLVRMQHRPGIDIGVGPYVDFALFWVLSIGFEKVWRLGELVPDLQIRFGTFHNDLRSVVGTRSSTWAEAPGDTMSDNLPEIVFDEPALV